MSNTIRNDITQLLDIALSAKNMYSIDFSNAWSSNTKYLAQNFILGGFKFNFEQNKISGLPMFKGFDFNNSVSFTFDEQEYHNILKDHLDWINSWWNFKDRCFKTNIKNKIETDLKVRIIRVDSSGQEVNIGTISLEGVVYTGETSLLSGDWSSSNPHQRKFSYLYKKLTIELEESSNE